MLLSMFHKVFFIIFSSIDSVNTDDSVDDDPKITTSGAVDVNGERSFSSTTSDPSTEQGNVINKQAAVSR